MSGISHISPSQSLAVALACVAAIAMLFALWNLAPGPLLAREAKIREIRAQIATLEKQRVRLGDLDRWTAARERALATRSEFLTQDNDSPAFAQIQLSMRGAADVAGVSIVSAQAYSPPGGSADVAGVRMNVAGDLNAVTAFLSALASARPRLIISELTIRPRGGQAADAEFNVSVAALALYWKERGA